MHAATLPGFAGCRAFTVAHPKLVVRPRSLVVACGDGNFWLGGLRWTTWTAAAATGTGTAHQNDCAPNCAAGHFHTYPATVRLDRPHSCHGRTELTRVSWRFTAAKPTGVARAGSQTFRCA